MSTTTATRWYCGLESLKRAAGIVGSQSDVAIAEAIEAASQDIETLLSRNFIPITDTKLFRWPRLVSTRQTLYLEDYDLLALTALQTKAQDDTPQTIAAADYFLEPQGQGPPYSKIEIDISSSSSFQSGNTPQRSISVAGRWGYCEDTKAAGALAEADDGSETALDITDASLIDVGETLLIGTEALFVSGRSALTTTATLNDTLTASNADVTVTVSDATKLRVNEPFLADSEWLFPTVIAGNDVTVIRAWNGSLLAAHTTGITLYALRTLTVVRGVNDTTAAAHDTATAIRKYAPPGDIVKLCRAMALGGRAQDESKWTGQISGGEGGVPVRQVDLYYLRERAIELYAKVTF